MYSNSFLNHKIVTHTLMFEGLSWCICHHTRQRGMKKWKHTDIEHIYSYLYTHTHAHICWMCVWLNVPSRSRMRLLPASVLDCSDHRRFLLKHKCKLSLQNQHVVTHYILRLGRWPAASNYDTRFSSSTSSGELRNSCSMIQEDIQTKPGGEGRSLVRWHLCCVVEFWYAGPTNDCLSLLMG